MSQLHTCQSMVDFKSPARISSSRLECSSKAIFNNSSSSSFSPPRSRMSPCFLVCVCTKPSTCRQCCALCACMTFDRSQQQLPHIYREVANYIYSIPVMLTYNYLTIICLNSVVPFGTACLSPVIVWYSFSIALGDGRRALLSNAWIIVLRQLAMKKS